MFANPHTIRVAMPSPSLSEYMAYWLRPKLRKLVDSDTDDVVCVGSRDAIGVFLWEAGSEIDRSVNAVNNVTGTGTGTNSSATLSLPELGENGTE